MVGAVNGGAAQCEAVGDVGGTVEVHRDLRGRDGRREREDGVRSEGEGKAE